MSDTVQQILWGFGGIAAGVVIVLGSYWVRYGVIGRRRQRRELHAMIDAALAKRPNLDWGIRAVDPFASMAKPVVDQTPVPPEALARIVALADMRQKHPELWHGNWTPPEPPAE